MMSKLKVCVGIYGMQDFFGGDLRGVIDSIRIADQAGIDQVSMTDHVVMGERVDRYPYGDFPSPLTTPWYEPIATLSAIAGCTDNIRLSTGVLISPLRPAVLLAKQLATLDLISRGRLEIGIGTGWQEEEYIASGIPFEGRLTRMEEQIRVCRELWSEAPASVNETTVQFDKIHAFPRPVQGRDMPVWFGIAPTPRNCQRIAELGHGWIPISYDPKDIAEGVKNIKAAYVAAGRDPNTLEVRVQLAPQFDANGGNFEKTLEGLDAMIDAGATMLEALPLLFCKGPQDLPKFYERLAKIKR
jgi:probable F420-dependent oxidoreductase